MQFPKMVILIFILTTHLSVLILNIEHSYQKGFLGYYIWYTTTQFYVLLTYIHRELGCEKVQQTEITIILLVRVT